MLVVLGIHSSLQNNQKLQPKYLIVFRHLDKSRNSIPSSARLWPFATSSHRVLFEGCYTLLIKTGRKRCDAKEDAGLQKE